MKLKASSLRRKKQLISLCSDFSREKGEDTNQLNKKWKKKKKRKYITASTEIQKIIRDYYRKQSANKMDKLGKNGQILRKVQPSKTEPGRNRKHEQTNQKKWN